MKQLSFDGLPQSRKKEIKNQREKWYRAFQKWSDDNHENNPTSPMGKCGYMIICDYCDTVDHRPCCRAVREYAKENKIQIDYTNFDFDIFMSEGVQSTLSKTEMVEKE